MWTLLASDNAPETLAYLQLLLYGEDRSLPMSLFDSRLKLLLDQMTDETVDDAMVRAKANAWVNAGFLAVHYPDYEQEPVIELTAAAHEAIRFIASQDAYRVSPTESRLELVIHAIRKLVSDTDRNAADRIARLEEDKVRIDEKIEQIRAGRITSASEVEIKAQIYDLLQMLDNLNGDFYRVRDRFRSLSSDLHRDIMRNSGTAGDILNEFFTGYDRIADSDEGRTFRAFYALISSAEAMAQIDEAVEVLQDRDFWMRAMNDGDRRSILYMRQHLNERARETQNVMRLLASSLKHLVQSREYQQNKRLSQLIAEAKRQAIDVADKISPTAKILPVNYTGIRTDSLAGLSLYDTENDPTGESIIRSEGAFVNLEDLARRIQEAEINYPLLKSQVAELLKTKEVVTVGDVLRAYPAKQGLASLVGLISLSVRYGLVDDNAHEKVTWKDRFGTTVTATVQRMMFVEESLKKFKGMSDE